MIGISMLDNIMSSIIMLHNGQEVDYKCKHVNT